MWRILPSSPVVRLRQASPPSVGPVETVGEPDGVGGRVGPAHHLVGVVHDPAGPEEPLGVLGDQTVELILLGGSVQGDRLHAQGLAVLLGLLLLEGGAADLPGHHVPDSIPEVVGSSRPALAGSARNTKIKVKVRDPSPPSPLSPSPVLRSLDWDTLRLSDHLGLLGRCWLGWLGPEYWGLLETSLGGSGPELLLLLGLELLRLRLGLEELLLLLLLLELLLLKLLRWSPLWLWSGVATTKETVKGVCDPTKEASILGIGQR